MKPIAGQSYTVKEGDYLTKIAAIAYGDFSKWTVIYKANQTVLKSGNPALVYPGEIIQIPLLAEREKLKTELSKLTLPGKKPDDLDIIIGGKLMNVISAKITLKMDTVADGCSCVIPWTPKADKDLDEIVKSYSYSTASVYIGGELVLNGLLYNSSSEMTISGIIKTLDIFSFTADAIDSTLKPPYEESSVTLKQRAEDLASTLGISVEIKGDAGGKFDRVTAESSDTIASHLAGLCSQRGYLLSSTAQGNFLIWQANTTGASIETFEQGQPLPVGWKATYNGRARFNVYKANGQSPGGDAKTAISKDDNVPRSRFMTFTADDTTNGDIQKAADWKRSKQLADSQTMPFPVTDWYTSKGKRWTVNEKVSVTSDVLELPDGADLLIKSIEFNYQTSGRTATLNLVPPEVFTGEPLKV